MVLEEQKFLVEEMMAEASRRRKFEEVRPLQQSVDDLAEEILRKRALLGEGDD